MKFREEIQQSLIHSRIGIILGAEGVRAVIEAGDFRRRSSGGKIFQEGDTATGFYLILKGKVKVSRQTPDGRETILHFAEAPSIIAEAAIFLGKYPATAEVVEDVELLFLSKSAALELIEHNGRFARWYIDSLTFWLQRLVGRIEELTTSDAASRLARYLLDLLEKSPPRVTLTAPKVTLPLKKGELAGLLNMQLPSLSRILRKMQDERLIEVSGKTITLINIPGLRRATLPPLP